MKNFRDVGPWILGLCLLFLSIRASDVVLLSDVWFVEVMLPQWLKEAKNYSLPLAASCLVSVVLFHLINTRTLEFNLNKIYLSLFLYTALVIYIARGIFHDFNSEIFVKGVLGLIFNTLLFAGAIIVCSSRSTDDAVFYLLDALFVWSLLYSILNIYLYLSGYGLPGEEGRFYGAAGHPNFLGVAMAVAVYVQFCYLRRQNLFFMLPRAVFFLASLFILYISLSRTGWVVFLVMVLIYYYLIGSLKAKHIFLALPVFLFFLIFWGDISSSVFGIAEQADSRLLENTREESWAALILEWFTNPLLGSGQPIWATENSILKALAFGGVVLALPFLGIYFFVFMRIFSGSIKNIPSNNSKVWAILVGLLVGGLLEGFLLELAGVWVAAMYYLLVLISLEID